MVLGFGGALISPTILVVTSASPWVVPVLVAVALSIGTAGIYQRKHHPVAMTVSTVLALLVLVAFLAFFPIRASQAIAQSGVNVGVFAYFIFILLLLTWALTIPLRLLMQMRTWKRLGLDLAALEAELRNRG